MITFNIIKIDNVVNKDVKALIAFICKTINAFNIND